MLKNILHCLLYRVLYKSDQFFLNNLNGDKALTGEKALLVRPVDVSLLDSLFIDPILLNLEVLDSVGCNKFVSPLLITEDRLFALEL